MASTLTPWDAISILKKQQAWRQFDDSSFQVKAANDAVAAMWRAYEWRGSLVELPPFYLVPGSADQSPLTGVVPTDFWYLRDAWLRNVEGNEHELRVERDLPRTFIYGQPESVCYVPETDRLRVYPAPSDGFSSPYWHVEGRYKKTPSRYSTDDLGTTALPFDDMFFHVYRKALEWVYLDLVGSPQAGSTQWQNGTIGFTGKKAEYMALLNEAIEQSEQSRGQMTFHPAHGSLGSGQGFYYEGW